MAIGLYLLLGAFAGFIAGLFGVGGGLIIVPVLLWAFTAQGYDPTHLTHLAVGTSLATIMITSISSVNAHHRRGAVRWAIFRQLAPGLMVGCGGGSLYCRSIVCAGVAAGDWLVCAVGGMDDVCRTQTGGASGAFALGERAAGSRWGDWHGLGGVWDWRRQFDRAVFDPLRRGDAASSRNLFGLWITDCSSQARWALCGLGMIPAAIYRQAHGVMSMCMRFWGLVQRV
jgi:hypothetical protein